MNEKMLGKITKAEFGLGGYQDCQLGLHLQFRGGPTGVGYSYASWDYEKMKRSEHAKWTEEDRLNEFEKVLKRLSKTLEEAKVSSVSDLVGIPVEVQIENSTFKDFRVLTEVI